MAVYFLKYSVPGCGIVEIYFRSEGSMKADEFPAVG